MGGGGRPKRVTTRGEAGQHWLAGGVTGRRKRNQGRLAKLHDMRAQHGAMRAALEAAHWQRVYGDEGTVIFERVYKC